MPAETPPESLPGPIQGIVDNAGCRLGFAAHSLSSGSTLSHLCDDAFTQASAIKIPIVWELYRAAEAGELSLSEPIAVDPADGAGGCGVLQNFAEGGSQIALGDLAVMMIVLSDNVATNLLINRVTPEGVNRLLDGLGAPQTRLRRKMMDFPAREAGLENTSTPSEAVGLMSELHKRAASGDSVADHVQKVLRLKKESPVTDALAKKAKVTNKPGALDGLRTDWSIIERGDQAFAMAIMADGAADEVLKPLFEKLATAIHGELMPE